MINLKEPGCFDAVTSSFRVSIYRRQEVKLRTKVPGWISFGPASRQLLPGRVGPLIRNVRYPLASTQVTGLRHRMY